MGIPHTQIKNDIKKQFSSRIENILKTELHGRNKVKAINTFAIPILLYTFGIIKWTSTDLNELNRLVRTLLTKHRLHHPKSSTERVILPTYEGGLGIFDTVQLHYKQIADLRQYFYSKGVKCKLFEIVCKTDTHYTPLHLSNHEIDIPIQTKEQLIDQRKSKELHGHHPHQLNMPHIDKEASNVWLKQGNIYGETVGFMRAIQDRIISTKNYRKFILKENVTSDQCRRCKSHSETIEHIMGSCTALAATEYTNRHDNVAKIIHQELARKNRILDTDTPYYKYHPPDVIENDDFKLYWNADIRTDRTIKNNRPDIVLIDKNKRHTTLIDVTIPLNHNVQKAHSTKINKYTELAAEVKALWKMQSVDICPIVITTTGITPCEVLHQLKKLNMEKPLPKIQKSVILDTCHIVRRFLSIE
jgi:hypothetical protein